MKYIILFAVLFCATSLYAQQTDTAKHYIIHLKLQTKYTDPANWTQEAINTVQRHFLYYQEMEKTGDVIFGGRTDYKEDNPSMFGIIILKANSSKAAAEVLNNDPAILAGIMQGAVHPFVVAFPGK